MDILSSSIWETRCQCCLLSFLNCLFKKAKRGRCRRAKDHHLTPEELKAHPPLVLMERLFKEFRALQGHQGCLDHRAQLVYQVKDSQGYQENQGLLVHRGTQELENRECRDYQENQEGLDYLEQKVNLVRMVVKDQLDFLGLQGCQVHLGCLGFQSQGVRAYQANQVQSGSQARKVFPVLSVLKA